MFFQAKSRAYLPPQSPVNDPTSGKVVAGGGSTSGYMADDLSVNFSFRSEDIGSLKKSQADAERQQSVHRTRSFPVPCAHLTLSFAFYEL